MSSFLRAGLLVLLCWHTGLAQIEIRLETLPPDCQILWSSPTGPRLMPARGGLVDLSEVDPRKVDKLEFVLLKPGYQDHRVSVPTTGLVPGARLRWPVQPGTLIRLEPILVSLRVHTVPSGAEVYLLESPGSLQYLGRADEELHFNLSRVGTLAARGQVEMVLRKSGFLDTSVSMPATYLQPDRVNVWPFEGGVALSPRYWLLSPLWDGLIRYPLVWVGLAVCLGFTVSRLTESARALWRRTRRLEDSVAGEGISPTHLAGSRLGSYRLLRVLGQGGMATVYLAIPDGSLDEQQPVAVKVLHHRDPEFRAEVQALRKLRHPNIVRMEDWGEFHGHLYLVLEYVAGPTLREFRGAPASEVIPLLRDVFAAVHYAHGQGLVHADLKPENVLVTPRGEARVTDFGLAVAAAEPGQAEMSGTLAYLAPERFRGMAPTPGSDQFSLGRMAQELLPADVAVLSVCERMQRNLPAARYPTVEQAWLALDAVLPKPQGVGHKDSSKS